MSPSLDFRLRGIDVRDHIFNLEPVQIMGLLKKNANTNYSSRRLDLLKWDPTNAATIAAMIAMRCVVESSETPSAHAPAATPTSEG